MSAEEQVRTEAEPLVTLLVPPAMMRDEPALERLAPGSVEALYAAREVDLCRAAVAYAEQRVAHRKAELKAAVAKLEAILPVGHGVTTGETLYYVAPGPDGNAEPNRTVLEALADKLAPLGLAPRTVTTVKLPTVEAIRRAGRSGKLRELGIRTGELLVEPPTRPKLRRRAIGTGEVPDDD